MDLYIDIDDEKVRAAFIRVCRDSNWKMEWFEVARFVAKMFKIHPLQVAFCFPYISVLDEIASGEHQACGTSPNSPPQQNPTM